MTNPQPSHSPRSTRDGTSPRSQILPGQQFAQTTHCDEVFKSKSCNTHLGVSAVLPINRNLTDAQVKMLSYDQ